MLLLRVLLLLLSPPRTEALIVQLQTMPRPLSGSQRAREGGGGHALGAGALLKETPEQASVIFLFK
jgi:hypothetical protein